MIADVVKELQNVGPGLGANTTLWSSYLARPGDVLEVDTERLPWELVFGDRGHGTGLEPAILGSDPPQVGTRGSGNVEMGSFIQSKVVGRATEDGCS